MKNFIRLFLVFLIFNQSVCFGNLSYKNYSTERLEQIISRWRACKTKKWARVKKAVEEELFLRKEEIRTECSKCKEERHLSSKWREVHKNFKDDFWWIKRNLGFLLDGYELGHHEKDYVLCCFNGYAIKLQEKLYLLESNEVFNFLRREIENFEISPEEGCKLIYFRNPMGLE